MKYTNQTICVFEAIPEKSQSKASTCFYEKGVPVASVKFHPSEAFYARDVGLSQPSMEEADSTGAWLSRKDVPELQLKMLFEYDPISEREAARLLDKPQTYVCCGCPVETSEGSF